VHELSIMSYLLETVEQEAVRIGARKVVGINLVIGERASVIDDSLLFCFDMLTPGTVAEGATVHIRRTAMRFHCEKDGHYTRRGDDFRCPHCHTVGRVTDEGSELLVESIEVEA
jgi:hydrogenase nickel incorporation protein HypA/HybF